MLAALPIQADLSRPTSALWLTPRLSGQQTLKAIERGSIGHTEVPTCTECWRSEAGKGISSCPKSQNAEKGRSYLVREQRLPRGLRISLGLGWFWHKVSKESSPNCQCCHSTPLVPCADCRLAEQSGLGGTSGSHQSSPAPLGLPSAS